ncbi:MAG: hypothetical protein R2838_02285 [Caldilineaceae bacterium]
MSVRFHCAASGAGATPAATVNGPRVGRSCGLGSTRSTSRRRESQSRVGRPP